MHRQMDELVGRVGTLEASTAAVQKDITEMKPITDDVRKWKLMGMGALAAIGIGAALRVTLRMSSSAIWRYCFGGDTPQGCEKGQTYAALRRHSLERQTRCRSGVTTPNMCERFHSAACIRPLPLRSRTKVRYALDRIGLKPSRDLEEWGRRRQGNRPASFRTS